MKRELAMVAAALAARFSGSSLNAGLAETISVPTRRWSSSLPTTSILS